MTLRLWIKKAGLSQIELARRARLSASEVSLLVCGKRVPTVRVRRAIERATGGAVGMLSWSDK